MIIHEPNSTLPAKLRGLHLFHDGVATCAQRVRFVLAEKGFVRGPDVRWDDDAADVLAAPDDATYVSRPVSIRRKQHMTASYAAIHPHMVVPALVHDGVLHIESVDIVEYIERTWPSPALIPKDAARRQLCSELTVRVKELHRSIRFILFRWALPGSAGKLSPREREALRALERPESPEQLADFYERYSTDRFPEEAFVTHVRRLEAGFSVVDALLDDGRPWLLGDEFSLADILWSLKMLRLWEVRYPLDACFPALGSWYRRVVQRPGFREAVWRETRGMSTVVRAWSALSHLAGGGIGKVAAAPGNAVVEASHTRNAEPT